MKSLLIVSCSRRKTSLPGSVPALERYDGGSYRVIRKMQRGGQFPLQVDIKIISARFGLIDAKAVIPSYDQRMNTSRALQLKVEIQRRLTEILIKEPYTEIYLDLGAEYLTTLDGFVPPTTIRISKANGRIGVRLHKLKAWLICQSGCEQI